MRIKKILALACCAVLLVCISVGATVAYLTDEEAVINTFTVGKVKITLDEAKVNEYGEPIDNAARVQKNEYKLIPGHTYTKDPTVTVKAGSEKSYIRMIVTINDITDLKAACGVVGDFLPQNFVEGWKPDVWVSTKEIKSNDNTCTYEFRYKDIVDASESKDDIELKPLFTAIKMPDSATNEQISALEELEINISAQAIQADGFDKADDAWDKVDMPVIETPAPTDESGN